MKLAILGCTGRMGRTVIVEAIKDSFFKISSGYCKNDDNFLGFDLGEIAGKYGIGVKASTNLEECIINSDAVIDFTTPEVTLTAVSIAAKHKKIFISGTTGISDEEHKDLISAGSDIPILWSSNMSVGVNLLNLLAAKTAKILDNEYDTEIVEMHHNLKKDAPSGTAITLGKTVADAKNINFSKHAEFSRSGIIGERKNNEIGFATLRGGSVIGDHTIIFAGENDHIEITHKATNRNIFAKGALDAAKWAGSKNPGYYTLNDIINSK